MYSHPPFINFQGNNFSATVYPVVHPHVTTVEFTPSASNPVATYWLQTWVSSYLTDALPRPNITINSSVATAASITILVNIFKTPQALSTEVFNTEFQYTMPLVLRPNTSVDMIYTVVQMKYGSTTWSKLISGKVVYGLVSSRSLSQ